MPRSSRFCTSPEASLQFHLNQIAPLWDEGRRHKLGEAMRHSKRARTDVIGGLFTAFVLRSDNGTLLLLVD
jgi:hypothetical protein